MRVPHILPPQSGKDMTMATVTNESHKQSVPFPDRPAKDRMKGGGDEQSRAIYERWAEQQGMTIEKRGANNSRLDHSKLDPYIREEPDYLCQGPNITASEYHEIKGSNNPEVVKIKLSSIEAGRFWNKMHTFRFWLSDTLNKSYAIVHIRDVVNIIRNNRIGLEYFPDGNAYHPIPRRLFPWIPLSMFGCV